MSADAGRPKAGHFPAQIEPPRPNRIIADSWRGLYGSDPFSSMWPGWPVEVLRNGTIGANNSIFAVFYVRVWGCLQAGCGRPWTLRLPNPRRDGSARVAPGTAVVVKLDLTARRAGRILKKAGSEKQL